MKRHPFTVIRGGARPLAPCCWCGDCQHYRSFFVDERGVMQWNLLRWVVLPCPRITELRLYKPSAYEILAARAANTNRGEP